MKLHLGLGRRSTLEKQHDPQVEKHRRPNNINAGSQWAQPGLADPPPYASVVAPDFHNSQATRPRHADRSSAAAGGAGAGTSSTARPMKTFSSSKRLREIAYLQAPMPRESKENALDMLRAYDTVIIMDDSGSMQQGGRWEQACDALSELAHIAATYDKDGIDIHFLNHPKTGLNIKDPKRVRHLFKHVRPGGPTPIGNKLDLVVGDYVERLESAARRKKKGDVHALEQIKPVNFIVITDGAATDEPLDSIVSLARRLDHGHFPLAQVGIQFVQVGDDKEATEFLKELDDDLSGVFGVRDMVDTTPFLGAHLTATMLIKILLGGINRRVDRRGGEAVMGR